MFNNLVFTNEIPTAHPIISVEVSRDSKAAIVITKENDEKYWLHLYDLKKSNVLYQEEIEGEWIKMKEVA